MTHPCSGCGLDFEDTPIIEIDADANPNVTRYFHNERCWLDWKARTAGEIRCFAGATALFAKAKEALLNAGIDWNSADPVIKVALIDGAVWEHALATDDFLDDVDAGGVIDTAATLGSPTIALGKADGADTTFASVTNAKVITAILFYVHNADPAAAPLVAIIEDAYGLPYTASGANIKVVYPSAGIFNVAAA
ncbi:MAG: hypothetical protein CMLOHMNK_02028 [Steroidobacteraceae bacterium]|nr:hypothetical protein [Steroidobacteraceae bacterium]